MFRLLRIDVERLRIAGVAFLILAALSATSVAAQDAVERLQAMVDELRPHVEAMEAREEPPTAEEMGRAQPYIDRINAAIQEVEELLESSGTTETPPALRAARKLLRRIAGLDLVRRAAELRGMVEELWARPEPPGEDEVEEVRRFAEELQASMLDLESESRAAQPSKKSVREAEKAVALSKSADIFTEVEEGRGVLEDIEPDPSKLTEEEAETARTTASQLQTSIDQAQREAGIKKGESEPPGLKRARGILIQLVIVNVAAVAAKLRPGVERLESLSEPPSSDELEAVRPLVEELTNSMDSLEKNLKIEGAEQLPPEVVSGLDVLRRFARLDLRRSLTDLGPVVEARAQQEEPLTAEQVEELRTIPGILRPKIRAARRTLKKDPMVEDQSASTEVLEATDLLERVQNLVPDSPAVTEEPVDAPDTQPVTRFFRFYGSLRLRGLVTPGNQFELDGQTSRIGVRAEGALSKNVKGFVRVEMGFNFLEATEEVFRNLDEGRGTLEESLFFQRLTFVGVDFHQRRISFGKQWSAFYDVGVFSDQMPFFSGEGTGVYSAGSDGGIAGTGRADQALQFRDAIGIFKFSVQTQIRNETENNQPFADTVGGSVTWKATDRMQVGGAFNVVRDGIPDPGLDKPREGDRAFIVGYRYQTDEVYGAATLTVFNNHDTDNLGTYFSGMGLESYLGYNWSKRLLLRGALSFLNPDSAYPGKYQVLTVTSGASYDLTRKIRLVFLTRLDFSTLADGSDRNRDIVSLSVFYNF